MAQTSWRRTTAVALVVGLIAAACGGSESSESPAGGLTTDPVTLTVQIYNAGGQAELEYRQAQGAEFTSLHPNVTIEIVQTAEYIDALLPQIVAGTAGGTAHTVAIQQGTVAVTSQQIVVVAAAAVEHIVAGATIKNTSGANTLTTGAVTMNAATAFDIAASTSLTITAAIGGAVANDLAKNSTGALYLTNTGSGYLGGTSINAGSLYITKLASAGTASSIGAPTTATTKHFIFMNTNTNFIYIGTTADTTNDRPFVPVGTNPSISIYSDGTGSGSMTIGSTWNNTYSTGTRTFNVLGDSANTNTWSGAFGAPPSGSLYLTKNGSTRWDFTNATFGVAYLSVQEGILGLGSYNRTITSSLTVYNTGHVQLLAPYTFNTGNISFGTGGKIEAELVNASATLLVPSDCTESQKAVLIATNTTTGGNTIGGAVTINGVIDVHSTPSVQVSTAGNGLVFGTGTVTVSSTGMIRTKAIVSSSQRGQCRYSNLVLQSGSKLKIGYAS